MTLFLGIDIGTQSVKTLCFEAESSSVVASASAELELISRDDGTREQLAEWWITALQDCLARIDPVIKKQIVALGVSGQQHGFVPVAGNGEVLAPVKLWCDTVTAPQCEQIMASFGGEARCISELGNAILPGYTAPKILWLKQHKPEVYSRLATVLLPHDYINFYLTGNRVMECGDASGTGLLDIRQRRWHGGLLKALDGERDLSACLPELVDAGEFIGELLPDIAAQLGLPSDVKVSCGGGDNMMAAIGTGTVSVGRLTVSMGTSGTLFAYADKPIIDEGGTLAAFCDSTGAWLPLLCTMNCTVATELTRGVLNVPLDALEERVAHVPPGSRGVMTLPFFQGERTPNLPNGQGSVMGLNNNNYSADNLLRSAMESAVYGLRIGLDTFRKQGCEINSVRLTGGGSKNVVWRQMVADIFDLPVHLLESDEGAAFGAALQACWVYRMNNGETVSIAELVDGVVRLDAGRSCEPVAANVSAYSKYYEHYLRHVDAVSSLYH